MSAAVGLLVPAILALLAVATLVAILRTYATVPHLANQPSAPEGVGPRVSIIVAARDEERHIRPAVASLLGQDYHDVELIVVEDRSTDRTGKILDAMAAKTERLAVVHIKELPPGWLGKNNALQEGAKRATGELLLFIDGDIMLHRSAVSRAVRVFSQPGADHVTVGPQMELPTWPLKLVVGYFLTWGVVAGRLWLVENPKSSAYIGVGAFNMVRASSYKAVGGHSRIAMRPDDDLMLGKILKKAGGQTRLLFGSGMVAVEWYASLGEALLGFRKNAFSVLNYSVALFVLSMIGNVVLNVLPFIAVFFTHGAPQVLNGVVIAALLASFARTAVAHRLPLWLTLLYPVAALVQSAMVVIAVMRTLNAGGIDWRGTFYPLDQLRANRV
jgi:glycosyltransferase involved in cell wall biosynthesis